MSLAAAASLPLYRRLAGDYAQAMGLGTLQAGERMPSVRELMRRHQVSLSTALQMLRHLEVGVDVIRSERSADIALYTKFDSLEDLQAYQVHPYHANEVAAYMRSVCSSVTAADYQV